MRGLGMVLSWWLAAAAAGQAPDRDAWQQLAAEGAAAGLDAGQFGGLVGRCQAVGMSVEAARAVAAPLMRAGQRHLPTEPVLAKIDEGLAKRADADRISHAAGVRMEMLERANALMETHRADDPRGRPGLIVSVALALESGVPEAAVAGLLSHPNTERPGWLMGTIEGLETLHAQGFPDADAERLMRDALARGLRRHEVSQAVDLALRRQREGADPTGIALEAGSPSPGGGGRHGNGGPPGRR